MTKKGNGMLDISEEPADAVDTIPAREWAEKFMYGSLRYAMVGWLESVRQRALSDRSPDAWRADYEEWSQSAVTC